MPLNSAAIMHFCFSYFQYKVTENNNISETDFFTDNFPKNKTAFKSDIHKKVNPL